MTGRLREDWSRCLIGWQCHVDLWILMTLFHAGKNISHTLKVTRSISGWKGMGRYMPENFCVQLKTAMGGEFSLKRRQNITWNVTLEVIINTLNKLQLLVWDFLFCLLYAVQEDCPIIWQPITPMNRPVVWEQDSWCSSSRKTDAITIPSRSTSIHNPTFPQKILGSNPVNVAFFDLRSNGVSGIKSPGRNTKFPWARNVLTLLTPTQRFILLRVINEYTFRLEVKLVCALVGLACNVLCRAAV